MKEVETIEMNTCMCEEEWEFLLNEGEALFNECNLTNYFYVKGKNVNWRGEGVQTLKKEISFKDILQRLSRAYKDFRLKACFFPKRKEIELIVSHHDCPTGSYYLLKAINEEVLEKLQERWDI